MSAGELSPGVGMQPWLHDLVVALSAPTQVWAGRDGQIRADGAQGVYHGDVRILSRAQLTIAGREPTSVVTVPDGASGMRAVGIARHLGDAVPDPTVRIDRRRTVAPGRLGEEIVVVSSAENEVSAQVSVDFATDMLGIDDVKSGSRGVTRPARLSSGTALWSDDVGVDVRVAPEGATLTASGDAVRATWDVVVPPGEEVVLRWTCEVRDQASSVVAATADDAMAWQVSVDADDWRLARWVRRSLDDLAALRMATSELPDQTFVAAGAPWFLTLFGRDSLWTARMLLPLGTGLAASTLRVLASRQGRQVDVESAEEPGKILHELRREGLQIGGDPARPEGLVLPPVYYGTVDATALWVCLLHDAWRWGMPEEDVEQLVPALEAALRWMVGHGDSDGDGFLEYVDDSGHGLTNQGWKDSGDSVQWRHGGLADAPIALCEVQGYSHEAAVGGAALLEHFGRPESDRWREWAHAMERRFRERFWVHDEHGDYPAIALDAAKRPVDSLTSNIGHLLGTGLLTAAEEATVAARLAAPEMSSGFGLRTLSAGSGGYSPLSYHGGSVWPHDTGIALLGLARAGQQNAAAELLTGLLAAADAFDGRLPELYGGDARQEVPVPVPYPAACRPQAWSAATAVAALSAVVGLRPDVPAGRLDVMPLRPSPVGAARVRGLRVGGRDVEVAVDAQGEVVTAPTYPS